MTLALSFRTFSFLGGQASALPASPGWPGVGKPKGKEIGENRVLATDTWVLPIASPASHWKPKKIGQQLPSFGGHLPKGPLPHPAASS